MKKFILGILFLMTAMLGKSVVYADGADDLVLNVEAYDYEACTVDLSWNALDEADHYIVVNEADSTENTQKVVQKENAITVGDLEYGVEYNWHVVAIDLEGVTVATSNSIELAMPKGVTQLKTTSLSAKKVSVYWPAEPGATAYELYYKLSSEKKYTFLKETSDTRAKVSVKDKMKYNFMVVPKFVNNELVILGAQKECSFNNNYFVSNDHKKYTYKEMENDIKALCKKYSEYVSYTSIGTSVKGKQIYDVVLGNPDADKSLLVVCELHAREYVTTVTCMKQLEYYLKNYNKKIDGGVVADTFNECNVHYVMMANPDGVAISQNKIPTWKGNANGVNLNRNFPYKFQKKGKKGGNDYTGPKAASEKETKAIIDITKKLKKQKSFAVISYHAMGQIVFGSYHAKNKRVKKMIDKMYKVARRTTGYVDAGSYDGGTSSGCYREYLIYNLKVPCITIEVGFTACPVEQKYYNSIYEKNKLVVLREARLL